jgi:DNA-binding GntR family transcriptional regulator
MALVVRPRSSTVSVEHEAPRYVQVADALARDIESGRYPVGSLLPPEPDLCSRYGVSRHTLREATRRLVDAGLISRRQGIGTRVKARTADTRYVASINALEDLFEYTRQTRLELLGETVVRPRNEISELLGSKEGQLWLAFRTLRFPLGSGDPIAHMTAYVPPEFEAIRDHLGRVGISVYRLIEEQYGLRIVEAQQRVEAIALDDEMARLLHATPGSPALRISRCYLGADDRVLSASVNVHPSERFVLVTGWRLDWRPVPE